MHKIVNKYCVNTIGNLKKWADKFTKNYDAILYFTRNQFIDCAG